MVIPSIINVVHSEYFLIAQNLDGPAIVFEEREDLFAPIKPFLLYALGEKMLWLLEKRCEAQVQGDSSFYGLWVYI